MWVRINKTWNNHSWKETSKSVVNFERTIHWSFSVNAAFLPPNINFNGALQIKYFNILNDCIVIIFMNRRFVDLSLSFSWLCAKNGSVQQLSVNLTNQFYRSTIVRVCMFWKSLMRTAVWNKNTYPLIFMYKFR